MQAESHQWHLFGLDLARVGRYLRAGWNELLLGEAAGLRRRIDAPVALLRSDGVRQAYVAEIHRPDIDPARLDCQAVELPGAKVLLRRLRLPRSLELELPNAVALEVRTQSPFEPANTVHGWKIVARADDFIEVSLAIAARDDVLGFLKAGVRNQNGGVGRMPEVWVLDDRGVALVLSGFGEVRRQKVYPRRVAALATRLVVLLVCLLLLLAIPPIVRSLQSDRMAGYLEQAQAEAAEAQALRVTLLDNNARIQELQTLIDQRVDQHELLELISRSTPDNVFIQSYEVEGRRLRLVGQAVNAAAYQQLVSELAVFQEVSTPTAFNQDRRTGLERFVLDIRLAADNPAGGG